MAIYDDGELNLLYELIVSLFHLILIDLLLIQGSLDTVNDIRDGAIIGVV